MRHRRHRHIQRAVSVLVGFALVAATAAPALALEPTIVWSYVLPGTGQAHNGHYTRAAIFATAAVASGFGLFVTQIHYNRAAERYNDQKRIYLDYPRLLESGKVVPLADIESTYQQMQAAWNDAQGRYHWRNAFVGALVATYVLNAVDVIMSKPETGELEAPSVSVQMRGDRVMIVKSISF